MTTTLMETAAPGIDPTFSRRDVSLAQVRGPLLTFASKMDLLDGVVCTCGAPDCPARSAELLVVERLLVAILTNYRPESPSQSATGPDGSQANTVRKALMDFGAEWDLFKCPCDDPNCPTTRVHDLGFLELVDLVWHAWVGRSGHLLRSPVAAEIEKAMYFKDRNFRILKQFTDRLITTSMTQWRDMLARSAATRATRLHKEAQHLISHGRTTWMGGTANHEEVRRLDYAMIAIPERAGLQSVDVRDGIIALTDGMHAIQMLDIADASFTDALYAPLEPLIPISELKDRQARQETAA